MLKRHSLLALIASTLTFAGTARAEDLSGPIYLKTRFSIDVNSNWADLVWTKMDPTAVGVAIEAGCLAYGTDCSKEAAAAAQIIKQIKAADKHEGNEHHGIYNSPPGYEICTAKIDYAHAGFSANATLSTQIIRRAGQNGLGFYADVAKDPGRGTGIDVDLYVQFVPQGKTTQYACWPDKGIPWNCLGHGACNDKPDIFSTAHGIYPPARYSGK